MIPRGTPDLSWFDLGAGLCACLWQESPQLIQRRLEELWSPDGQALACLSVRSGFDLVCQSLALSPGSEVLCSAITIPDMLRILEQHGLVPIPIDIDASTLSVSPQQIEQAIGPRTRAILIAHLFGSRMSLDAIAQLAREHGLWLLEDCAQAYDASAYRGHAGSDVSLFSFGPIKTATALGGGLLRFKDPALLARVRALQELQPRQSWLGYAGRLMKFVLLKGLANPAVFGLFAALCHWWGVDHDQVLSHAVRGFRGDLFDRIRRQPCAPLLSLLERRLRRPELWRIKRRAAFAKRVADRLGSERFPGQLAKHHSHWVLPLVANDPAGMARRLWSCGFDATQKASSLVVVPAPADRPELEAVAAQCLLDQLLYLPMFPEMTDGQIDRLAAAIHEIGMREPCLLLRDRFP